MFAWPPPTTIAAHWHTTQAYYREGYDDANLLKQIRKVIAAAAEAGLTVETFCLSPNPDDLLTAAQVPLLLRAAVGRLLKVLADSRKGAVKAKRNAARAKPPAVNTAAAASRDHIRRFMPDAGFTDEEGELLPCAKVDKS